MKIINQNTNIATLIYKAADTETLRIYNNVVRIDDNDTNAVVFVPEVGFRSLTKSRIIAKIDKKQHTDYLDDNAKSLEYTLPTLTGICDNTQSVLNINKIEKPDKNENQIVVTDDDMITHTFDETNMTIIRK